MNFSRLQFRTTSMRPNTLQSCFCGRNGTTHLMKRGMQTVTPFQGQLVLRAPRISFNAPTKGHSVVGAVGLGLGLGFVATMFSQGVLHFQRMHTYFHQTKEWHVPIASEPAGATNAAPPPNAYDPDQPLPPPKSIANYYELTFGTVCGICAGVFIKKGLKAAAFLLGGVFVLLQVSYRLI